MTGRSDAVQPDPELLVVVFSDDQRMPIRYALDCE